MSGLDIEALLEETANEYRLNKPAKNDGRLKEETDAPSREKDLLDGPRTNDTRSEAGSVRSPRRRNTSSPEENTRDRDRDRRRRRDDDDDRHYRPSGGRRSNGRARSRSPYNDDRYYRPDDRRDRNRRRSRERDDYRPRDRDRDRRDRDRDGDRDRHSNGRARDNERNGDDRRSEKAKSPTLNEDERDRRTVFVQQLAARLRTRELQQFFEQVGPVREAQIVKDRVSGRSKG